MTKQALLSIDQGTSSSRAILFSPEGDILHLAQNELTLHYPHDGWVEQDANDIWNDVVEVTRGVVEYAQANEIEIVAAGITNQRETTILWDRETGMPVYNAIVWQDRRTSHQCAALKEAGHEDGVAAKTGLLLDPYFSATKITWILDNVEGAREKAEAGTLAFGTVDAYLLWKLTGGEVHASDVTNASRTMLYNIVEQTWDEELLALFNIPASILPQVHDNAHDFGITQEEMIGAAIPIGGIAGDQQSALIGQGCFAPGMMKSTYGTGCFALMNIGPEFKPSKNRLLTTVAYRLDSEMTYAIEGSIFVAGAAMQWLRDGLEFFEDAAESEPLATSVPDNGGVYMVPAFTGLGAPYWEPEARGLISGLTRDSTKAHITRAALEAQAYQTLDLLGAMQADSGKDMATIRVDGGLVANGFMCQFLADMTGKTVELPRVTEATAWGAAALAGLQVGLFEDVQVLQNRWKVDKSYAPGMEEDDRAALYEGWKAAVRQGLASIKK